jgi:hypothetical protein
MPQIESVGFFAIVLASIIFSTVNFISIYLFMTFPVISNLQGLLNIVKQTSVNLELSLL